MANSPDPEVQTAVQAEVLDTTFTYITFHTTVDGGMLEATSAEAAMLTIAHMRETTPGTLGIALQRWPSENGHEARLMMSLSLPSDIRAVEAIVIGQPNGTRQRWVC